MPLPNLAPSSRALITVATTCACVAAFLLHEADRPVLDALCREDGPVEYLTALFYLAAGLLFLLRARCAPPFRIGFGLLFLLIAGEEVSWGQRLLGFATPDELAGRNVQEEFNVHNLDGLHQHVRAAGLVVVLLVAVVQPVAAAASGLARRLVARLRYPPFPLWATPIALLAIACMAIPRLFLGGVSFDLDEVGEAVLALAFLIFAVHAAAGARGAPAATGGIGRLESGRAEVGGRS